MKGKILAQQWIQRWTLAPLPRQVKSLRFSIRKKHSLLSRGKKKNLNSTPGKGKVSGWGKTKQLISEHPFNCPPAWLLLQLEDLVEMKGHELAPQAWQMLSLLQGISTSPPHPSDAEDDPYRDIQLRALCYAAFYNRKGSPSHTADKLHTSAGRKAR